MNRRDNLSTPRQARVFEVHYDNEAFGRFSESIASSESLYSVPPTSIA